MERNYIPLYRKYRPQSIGEIVGQEHIKRALTNAIEFGKISHAYLFTGPRGTGKTSTARIFAKSLNCQKGITINPCNECENCINITNSVPIDVIEMDAASNRSVSDAEGIIQSVALAPVQSRYKIFIIDEVHMLTNTAFNALLKTLEEPPENVIFILATTEIHKVLDTIKSRCQRFDFKRISTSDITNHLKFISDKEGINITDDALNYIAQNSAGGMRDSIALLDQLSVLGSKEDKISVDDINRLLGRLSFDALNTLFEAVSLSNSDQAVEVVDDIYSQGAEPVQILSNFLEFLRNALIVKSVNLKDKSELVQLNNEQISVVENSVANLEVHQITSLIEKCSSYIKELKLSVNPKLWLDVAVLDMANLAQNTKLEDLQKRIMMLESGSVVSVAAPIQKSSPVIKKPKKIEPEAEKAEDKVQNSSSQVVQHVVSNIDELAQVPDTKPSTSSNARSLWTDFLNNVSSFPSRAILKQQALPVKLSPEEVIISMKNQNWLQNFGAGGERHQFIVDAVSKLFPDSIPKITIRAPQQGDEKLRSENIQEPAEKEPPSSVKKPLILESQEPDEVEYVTSSVQSDNAISEQDNNDDKDDVPEQKTPLQSDSIDRSLHSDSVNMVMDIFEGKFIE